MSVTWIAFICLHCPKKHVEYLGDIHYCITEYLLKQLPNIYCSTNDINFEDTITVNYTAEECYITKDYSGIGTLPERGVFKFLVLPAHVDANYTDNRIHSFINKAKIMAEACKRCDSENF